jgi:hypothetical protein
VRSFWPAESRPEIWSLHIAAFVSLRQTRFCPLLRVMSENDRLCGLVVRVPGYRSGGPGSRRVEEVLERKSSDSGPEIREYGRENPSR